MSFVLQASLQIVIKTYILVINSAGKQNIDSYTVYNTDEYQISILISENLNI